MMPLSEDEKITIEVSGLILLINIYPVMLLKRPKCRFFIQSIMEHSYKNFFRYRTIFEGMRQKFEVDDRKVSSGFSSVLSPGIYSYAPFSTTFTVFERECFSSFVILLFPRKYLGRIFSIFRKFLSKIFRFV